MIPWETLKRLAGPSPRIPVIYTTEHGDEVKAYLQFDDQESQRFPGRIWVKIWTEDD